MPERRCAGCKHLDNNDVIFTVSANVFYKCTKHKRYTKLNWSMFCWEEKEKKT